MSATDLLIWGVVVHLVFDWLGQNEWMAVNKMKRRPRAVTVYSENSLTGDEYLLPMRGEGPWWDRHPAAYVHAGIHGAAQLLVFPWYGALAIGITHLIIDTRWPVQAWSKLIRQTQPDPSHLPLMDIGADVRIWNDQVWHIAVVAALALLIG
jgi:hypothetical protein